MRSIDRFFLVYCLLIGALSVDAGAQGFGTTHKQIILHRKLPPTVNLKPGSIKVEPQMGTQAELARSLAYSLQAELLKNGKQLTLDNDHPQTTIHITVVSYSPPEAQTMTVPGYQMGSKMPTTEQLTRVQSALSVAFEARDTAAGRTLDSDNVTARYVGTFAPASANSLGILGATPTGMIASGLMSGFKKMKNPSAPTEAVPTNGELQGKLLANTVAQIASHLVNTDESVTVLLARGKLDEANKLADTGLWSRYLETLEQMTPFPSPPEDAYRLYNIGVAYEASAYTAEEPKTAMKFLDQAAINYGKAVSAKQDERLFLEPQTRIETAIAHYKKLQDQQAAAAAPSPQTAAPPTRSVDTGTGSAGAVSPSKDLNNDQIIALAKAGMDEDNLIDTIKTAPTVEFDLSVPGQLALTQGGVKGRVLMAMKQRARAPAATPAKKK